MEYKYTGTLLKECLFLSKSTKRIDGRDQTLKHQLDCII